MAAADITKMGRMHEPVSVSLLKQKVSSLSTPEVRNLWGHSYNPICDPCRLEVRIQIALDEVLSTTKGFNIL